MECAPIIKWRQNSRESVAPWRMVERKPPFPSFLMQIFQSSLNPKPMNAFDNSFPLFTKPGTHAIVKFRYLLRLSLQNISFQTPKSCEDSVPWLST